MASWEAMLMMRPHFCCRISPTTSRQQRNTPVRSTEIVSFQVASVMSSSRDSVSRPALLTRMSTPPSCFRAVANAAFTLASSETSTSMAPAAPDRSRTATLSPFAKKASAMALPIPLAPPVTTTPRPDSLGEVSVLFIRSFLGFSGAHLDGETAINYQRLAGNVDGLIGGQEANHAGNLLRPADPAPRNVPPGALQTFGPQRVHRVQ